MNEKLYFVIALVNFLIIITQLIMIKRII